MSRAAEAWRLACFGALPSTQDYCRFRAEAGEPAGLAVLAGQQTSGRGTRGRLWQSPPGNLALSLLLRPDEPARRLGEWALLAAVAVAQALRACLPDGAALSCKWPNDVLLDGAKLAGVLVESATTAAGRIDWLVIGCGVNLASAPEVADRATAAVAAWAPPPEPQAFARTLLAAFDRWQAIRAAGGFAPVRDAWLAMAPPPGTPLTLSRPTGTLAGLFAGLGEDGRLLLRTGADVRACAAGET